MLRLVALWGTFLAMFILLVVLREERLAAQGKVPLGRLRRLWWRRERRRFPRYRINWAVRYLRMDSDPAAPGSTRDVSQSGAGLVVLERLPVGSVLQMELSVPGQDGPLRVTGEVVWSKEVPANSSAENPSRTFLAGIRFRGLTPSEAEAIAAALGVNESQESRDKSQGTSDKRQETRAKAYARLRRKLWLLDVGVSFGLVAFLLLSGSVQRLAQWVTAGVFPWPLEVALTMGLLGGAVTATTFPLDWLRGFRLEHRFGLSTQRFGEWLKDYGKGLAVAAVLGGIVVEALALLLRLSPLGWWAWAALLWMIWTVGLTRVAPQWLIPIFYRQRPLDNLPLRQRLERFMEECRTPVRGIFEINLSRTTRKANACLCGLGNSRRVLLSDTLLVGYPPEEVEVVLAHEVGHHRLHHIGILIAGSAAAFGFSCFLVDGLVGYSLQPLGLRGLEDPATLALIGWGLGLAQLALMPVTNGLSRRLEAQADRFALQATRNPAAFSAAMRRLADQNLAETDPPRWIEWFFYDHPPIAKRIALAQQFPFSPESSEPLNHV